MKNATPGFTLTELLVVIGIIAVLATILLPLFVTVRANSQRSACASNLRQIAAASLLYAQDNDGVLPHTDTGGWVGVEHEWFGAIAPYVKNKQVFSCPVCVVPDNVPSDESSVRGYAANANINDAVIQFPSTTVREGDVRFSTATVLYTESHFLQQKGQQIIPRYSVSGPDFVDAEEHGPGFILDSDITIAGLPGATRHGGGSNYAFVDGHVKWHKPEAVEWREHDENGYPLPSPNGTRPSFRLE